MCERIVIIQYITPTPLPPILSNQFDVTNTLNDQLLEEVCVEMEGSEGFSVLSYTPIPKLPYGQPATAYTLVQMEDPGIGGLGASKS